MKKSRVFDSVGNYSSRMNQCTLQSKVPEEKLTELANNHGTCNGLRLHPSPPALAQLLTRKFAKTSDHCLRKVQVVWVGRKWEGLSLLENECSTCHQKCSFLVVFHTHVEHLLSLCTMVQCCYSWYQRMSYRLYCVLILKEWGRGNQSRQMKVVTYLLSLSLSLKINPVISFVSMISELLTNYTNCLFLDYWILR